MVLTLIAGTAGVEKVAAAAANLDAAIPFCALPFGADQRTNAIGFAADGIERLEASKLDFKLCPRVPVEQVERILRAIVPVAVGVARITADTLEMGLEQSHDISLVDLWRWRWWRVLSRSRPRRYRRQLLRAVLRGAFGLLDL